MRWSVAFASLRPAAMSLVRRSRRIGRGRRRVEVRARGYGFDGRGGGFEACVGVCSIRIVPRLAPRPGLRNH